MLAAVIATCEAQKRSVSVGSGGISSDVLVAVTNADWLAHGAYEDWFYILPSNWWARAASGGWIGSLRVFSFGGFQAYGADRTWSGYPPPFPQKLSLAPLANRHLLAGNEGPQQLNPSTSQHSLFWHGVTGSNTLVMTWQNGLYARCATNLVSFQAELFNDGSVAYRYDGSPVATNDFVVPLELPFDRDGDGLENSVDPEPDVAGPDAHGTNAEWYNTVCSNVFEAVEGGGGHGVPALPWREGVNSNAYYFVDVVAERGPAPIWFAGDRASRLGDPVVVARAGASTCFELALTGKPAFLIPMPTSMRNHQHYNAAAFAERQAAVEGRQNELTPRTLANWLLHKAENRYSLAEMSRKISALAVPDAAAKVADLVERAARRKAKPAVAKEGGKEG